MHIYRTKRLEYFLLLQQSTKSRSSLRVHRQPHISSFSIAPGTKEEKQKEMKNVLHERHAAWHVNSVNLSKEMQQSSLGAIQSVQSHAGWCLEQPHLLEHVPNHGGRGGGWTR